MSNFRLIDREQLSCATVGGRMASASPFGPVRGGGGQWPGFACHDRQLSGIGRGVHPALLLGLIIYGYATGVFTAAVTKISAALDRASKALTE